MIEVRVLGPLRISASDGRSMETLARQSKRAALLAYLAAATPRGVHRRDKLLALFWPESDEAHARAALSQAVYVLRSMLGESAVVPRGDGQLGLSREVVWCDAAAFEEALDVGRSSDALGLYRGDLLDGFFVAEAPEFERWLDQERERLRQRAAEGAWTLAEARAAEGDPLEAERWARRAASLLPADEAVVRRLMIFLHALGDRAAAIRAYEAFAWRLAEEYELEPSTETRELAAAIRTHDAPPSARSRTATTPPPAAVLPARRGRALAAGRLIAAALATAALVGIAWASLRRTDSEPQPVKRFALDFAGVPALAGGIGGSTIAVSPDGAHLVYLGEGGDGQQLFLRSMDRLEAVPIPHTVGARVPFFSPDGEWLGFVVGTTIRKVRLTGGPSIAVWDAGTNVAGASWGEGDVIVFATPTGLWQVPGGGGTALILAVADTARGERYRWPDVLPSGRAAVFTRVDDRGFRLATVSLQTGAVAPLGLEGTNPLFVAPRHLVFARADGALLAAPFDRVALRLTGAAVPLADGVWVGIAGAAKLGVSRTGALAYVPELSHGALVLVGRSGRAETELLEMKGFIPRFSPDGERIAASVMSPVGSSLDIWLVDLAGSTQRRVTFDSGSVDPVWSPDGRRIAFASMPGGRPFGWSIHWISADGTEPPEALLPPAHDQFPAAFTPDGRSLAFQKAGSEGKADLWILPLSGERTPVPYAVGPSNERAASLSPDGRWLAYVSDVSGRDEVYVGGFPDRGVPVQVSSAGGREPRWSPDGRELFYRGAEGMIAVTLEVGTELRVGGRAVLFDDRPYVSPPQGTAYDVHPDGQRFAMIRRGSKRGDVVVVLNLFDQLRARRR